MTGCMVLENVKPPARKNGKRLPCEVLQAENAKLQAENAKLVDVLHEVEQEAIYAYHCLRQDCVTTANSSEHFFEKWRHAECELDRAKDETTKLCELAKHMHTCLTRPKVYDGEQPYLTATECPYFTEGACDYNACGFERRMRELGIEAHVKEDE